MKTPPATAPTIHRHAKAPAIPAPPQSSDALSPGAYGNKPPQRERTRQTRTRWGARGAMTALALTVIVALANSGSWGSGTDTPNADVETVGMPINSTPPSPAEALQKSGYRFLQTWVDPDGRVVRRNEGGDTVSEGQAYGMLIAVGLKDEEQFDSIWSWTKENILMSNGLLAWQWDNGMVIDQGPAADADLDAARALVQAGEHFNRPDLTADGHLLASNLLNQLSAVVPEGRVLLPGLWATQGPNYIYNPSYASPSAFTVLAESTGDARWEELLVGSRAVTAQLLAQSPLPPDWAQIKPDGVVTAMPGPQGKGPSARYSYDATRLAMRYAESCDTKDVILAAKLAQTLDRADPLLTTLDLGGSSLKSDQSAVAYVARASAHAAAHNMSASRADLKRADDLDTLYPSYYGSAWTALGRIMLDSATLGGCPAHTK